MLLVFCWVQCIQAQFRPPPNGVNRPGRPQNNRKPLPELRRPERQNSPQNGPQNLNRPPTLESGQDLSDFTINEDTPVGSVVYTLKGTDPEGSKVLYTISGDHFSVNRETGVITLRNPLDREKEEVLEVVVTIQDEAFQHIIPFRRQIRGTKRLINLLMRTLF